MNTTIFNTPILSQILYLLAVLLMRVFGWRVEGGLPDLPKFVMIGAPHTSNWDFILFLGTVFQLKANIRFMGKSELFRPPFGGFFRWCGGYPVDRTKSQGLVEQMVQAIQTSDQFHLMITPEGTRNKVNEWKRGFYHIARGAAVPVVLAVLDGAQKTVRVGQLVDLTEDIEADMKRIQGYYRGMVGIHPHRTSELSHPSPS
ncbi:MAG: glycerol acyltransferase [Chloroflexi bacterium]|nr:glycerol acyltransferase [Chloroflexota bacterium]